MRSSWQPVVRFQNLITFACILIGSNTLGQDAKVRTTLQATEDLWVGQKVTVVVELLAPGYFASAPAFDLPKPQSVLLMPPAEHPVVDNETIDDVMYTVQRHELAAYPMTAGEHSIPPFTVRFSYKPAPLDPQEIDASVQTTPLAYTVTLPPGAEDLGQVLSTRDLKVLETWKPEPSTDDVMSGQAFTRTVTYSAPEVPGMLFPPFATGQVDGLAIYTKAQLLDHSDRGSLQGERRDVITYVCQRPGQYRIPASRFSWFDLDSKTIRSVDLPSRTFNVVANPAMATATVNGSSNSAAPANSSSVLWCTFAVVAGGVFCLTAFGFSSRGRDLLFEFLSPLRAVRLQPLNPVDQTLSQRPTAASPK